MKFFQNLNIRTKLSLLIISMMVSFMVTITISVYHQVTLEFETHSAGILEDKQAEIAAKTKLVYQLARKIYQEDSKIENIEQLYKPKLVAAIDTTLSILTTAYQQLKTQGVAEEVIRRQLQDYLRKVRYDEGTGYLFAFDFNATVIAHGEAELEGKNLLNLQDAKGKYFIRDMITIGKSSGQGFVNYYWNKLGYTKPQLKLSYLKLFKPYNWILGAGIYVEDLKAAQQERIADLIINAHYDIGNTQNNYFFVLNSRGATIRNGGFPQLDGVDSTQFKDSQGKLFVQEFVKVANTTGHGFVYYMWPKVNNGEMSPKISYVHRFEPFNWIIGTGVYLDEIGITEAIQELKQHATAQIRSVIVMGTIILGLGIFLTIWLVHLIMTPLLQAKQAAEAIARGHFTTQLPYQAQDEVGQLINSLNLMANRLQEYFAKLDIQNQELQELNRLKDVFLTELEEKRIQLQEKNTKLFQLNQDKNEFLGIAAHDLKNPLQAIQGSAELIETGFDEFTRAELIEFAKIIGISAQRMFELIRNLLDVNAIESGKFNVSLKPVEILPLLQQLVKSYQDRAKLKEIQLQLNISVTQSEVVVDENLTYQVLDNLISNAIKYSPRGKQVWIRLTSTDNSIQLNNSSIRCEIKDEGPGLSVVDQQKLFGKFTRLTPQPTANEHSTGLGLFIVKHLVEMMKSKVWCESEEGRGATFIVEFPKI